MKRIAVVLVALLLSIQSFAQAKYVFLFIGDGMGANSINMTELYLSAVNGEIGRTPLCFTQFPVASVATTFSASSLVTDSAASGTAISCGEKTVNGRLGEDPDENRLVSVAEKAKRSGKKVAIVTTVGVNHATPAAFYGHQKYRDMYDQLLGDLAASEFDFFAGSAILASNKKNLVYNSMEEREKVVTDGGYTIVRSRDEFLEKYKELDKVCMIPDKKHGYMETMLLKGQPVEDQPNHLTLKDMVQSSVEFMMKDKCRKGFFVMAEGGEIDHGTHGNDAAMSIQEILGFNEAIEYAYQFYLQHPKETIIIVTADHDTGAVSLLGDKPAKMALIQNQTMPQSYVTSELRKLMRSQEDVVSWEQTKELLGKYLGLWNTVELTEKEEAIIRAEYDATVAKRESGHVVDPYAYADNAKIVATAVKVLNAKAGIVWATSGHSAGYVPVYAIGRGTEIFQSLNDNTDISKKISKIAKYK